METLINATSLPVMSLMLFLAMLAAAWAGNRARTWRSDSGNDAGEGYLLSAALALLGLLIAFTFSLAVSRYDSRRELVVSEANAIGTAWLRAGLSDDKAGSALQAAIARYTDVRLGLSRSEPADRVEAATNREQQVVWARLKEVIAADRSPVSAGTIAAVNEMFDAASSRKAERAARIPGEVLIVLAAYTIMAAGIVGYVMGVTGRRHRTVTVILFLLLTMAITLILDLDRPRSGAITVSQQPMWDARASMRR
ncbi:Protein of unknown function [Novosphingobium sp. CF614]|uniref:bestrophin-like domain n=1 Tax=Novosphingobium sp. CF614 TaxID=1884364 RepID=UPI0008F109F3|nr:DUF4239 domain-containing protein [Novosphingobium sp. CF614]SFF99246.1 Protein of unknown function [Novosphingobium sp. CF614]